MFEDDVEAAAVITYKHLRTPTKGGKVKKTKVKMNLYPKETEIANAPPTFPTTGPYDNVPFPEPISLEDHTAEDIPTRFHKVS